MTKFYLINLAYIISLICSFLFYNEFWQLLILLTLSSLIYTLILVRGVSNIRSQMFIKTYNSNPNAKNKVAITYDDGPDTKNTPKLLEILKKNNAKATFFMIGQNIVKYNDLAKQVHKEGHLIGNHSFSHSNFFPLKLPINIKKEVTDTKIKIEKLTLRPNNYFRPPYGVTNPFIAKGISKLKFKVIGWSIRSFDTQEEDKKITLKRITKDLKSGDIILLHDRTKHICWLTEEILKYLKINNLEAVTIEKLLFD